jgi:hypothetical protein
MVLSVFKRFPELTKFVFHLSIFDYLSKVLSGTNSSCTSSLELADSNVLYYSRGSQQILVVFGACSVP